MAECLIRLIAANLNTLSVMLEGECTPATCATMKTVGDCQFLCAAHKVPKEVRACNASAGCRSCVHPRRASQCPAIDYINHTLDGTCALLNNQRCFPSRWVPTACEPCRLPQFNDWRALWHVQCDD